MLQTFINTLKIRRLPTKMAFSYININVIYNDSVDSEVEIRDKLSKSSAFRQLDRDGGFAILQIER